METIPAINKENERRERGENVAVTVKFLRHGERDKDGRLTEYGREMVKNRPSEDGINVSEFDAVKAIGSSAGFSSGVGMRALETADIYARELAGDDVLQTRIRDALSYETLKNPVPYDHREIYNAYLPDNFDTLTDEEKSKAAKIAQSAVLSYAMSLGTEEAEAYRREAAGAFAYTVDHFRKMSKRLKGGSKVLILAGTHGGIMEFLLQQALVRRNPDGMETVGFRSVDEIGGEFSPAESYDILIKTDEQGRLLPLKVILNGANRPQDCELELDAGKVDELAGHYRHLHEDI